MIPCGRRGHRAGAVEVPQYDEVTGKEYWNCPKLASFDTSENGCSGSDDYRRRCRTRIGGVGGLGSPQQYGGSLGPRGGRGAL